VSTRRGRSVSVAAAVGALLLGGCGSVHEDEIDAVVRAFTDPAGDLGTRCDLLAPSTLTAATDEGSGSCPDAMAEVPTGTGELTAVEVWGEEAQARLTDDTLFLTRTPDGWRITAAACRPQGADVPYECALEG
jgi:hypothetical protein